MDSGGRELAVDNQGAADLSGLSGNFTVTFRTQRRQRPKLIENGWDTPDTKYVREHWREKEKLPFDGIVIKVYPVDPNDAKKRSLGWRAFAKDRFRPQEYEHAIEDLRSARFRRFTDNFRATSTICRAMRS